MTLTMHPNVVQGSDEWDAQRRGIITASVAGQLITVRKLTAIDYPCPACSAAAYDPCRSKVSGAAIKTLHPERAEFARSQTSSTVIEPASNPELRGLTMLLVAERITGWTDFNYVGDDMLRGIDDEYLARDKYAEHYAAVAECGFMVEDRWGFKIGYSPDGLVGNDGLIEIKSRRPKLHLAAILADTPPADTMAQLQCGLLVSGRAWIDYVSFCGGMPLWVKRVYPQQEWVDAIAGAAEIFEGNAAEMIAQYETSIAGLHPTERTSHDVELKL